MKNNFLHMIKNNFLYAIQTLSIFFIEMKRILYYTMKNKVLVTIKFFCKLWKRLFIQMKSIVSTPWKRFSTQRKIFLHDKILFVHTKPIISLTTSGRFQVQKKFCVTGIFCSWKLDTGKLGVPYQDIFDAKIGPEGGKKII